MVGKHLCPVCGFWMDSPPSDFNICLSCGTEFGLHDVNASVTQLRALWLKNGARWWGEFEAKPEGWDPFMQVSALLTNGSVWDAVFDLGQRERQYPSRLLAMISDNHKTETQQDSVVNIAPPIRQGYSTQRQQVEAFT